MKSGEIALYILGAPILLGIAFLLWALLRLELDKKHRGDPAAPPDERRRSGS